jgi:hypothetical protein
MAFTIFLITIFMATIFLGSVIDLICEFSETAVALTIIAFCLCLGSFIYLTVLTNTFKYIGRLIQ